MRHYQWLGTDSKNYMGNWTFNGQNTENPASPTRTGDAFADWVLGLPANAGRGFPSDTFGGAYTAWHFFVQDDFKLDLAAHAQHRTAVRVHAVGHRLSRPDRHVRRNQGAADHRGQQDQSGGPGRAARRAHGIRLFERPDPDQQRSGPAVLDHRTRTRGRWAPRFGFAWRPFGRDHGVARRLRHLL